MRGINLKKEKIIVWGTGIEAQKFAQMIDNEGIAYFADNNEEVWGKEFLGKKILSIRDFLSLPEKYLIVISTRKYEKEIREKLLENEIDDVINAQQYLVDRIFWRAPAHGRRVLLLNTHDNFNLGDYLITLAELFFFRKYMPEYKVVEVPLRLCSLEMDYISRYVKPDDLLVITGGGFLGSLWLEGGEINVRKIVQAFRDNRIIIFPQTMFFENTLEGERQKEISRSIYNAHKNLTVCFRDKRSYELGTEILADHIKKKYFPDMVTLLDRSDEIFWRKGILICFREDKERIVSEIPMEEIERRLREKDFEITNMSMVLDECVTFENRMDLINVKLRQIQTSRLVITDRLHCMLMCAISGTPCIAFDNISGKVSGVYQWIKENKYIYLACNDTDIFGEIDRLLNMPYTAYCNKTLEKRFEELAEFLKVGY